MVTLVWKTTVKYWYGSGVELQRTWARAWFVVRVWWTVVTLIVYATFYGVLFLYEIVEGVCLGWPGVVVLTVTTNYKFASNEGTVAFGGVVVNCETVLLDGCVVVLGVASHVWRWYEYTSEGRSPLAVAQDCYDG
ncbi:uncharacterized protein PITG_16811 [Phytophthora infestans T30-4]|uniref:Transmembrane protein n=1 Tax=Phytophthora infestans (strain T30-4) TaxID=403677 RepID=D0NUX6_PHYIT|nr:uncharacterized protein PITG_16811 [Phytophthora infestans T30-4]EEY65499.1 conserved hypothetical protein [Phytophthora infestans T30-4]|eukprot:XP_002897128.1 conserved hypothetical protein [Phytophthora infestans T30-4]